MLSKVKTHLLVTGCVRSGTTAVCEFLSKSPTIIIPAEFALYSEWDNPHNFMRVHTMMRARVNNRIFYYKGIHGYSFAHKLEIERTTGKQSLEKIVEACPDEVCVFGDKLPLTYLDKAEKLLDMFDNLKILVILRDGRNVMESQVRRAKGADYDVFWHRKDITQAEDIWLNAIKQTEKLKNKSNRILIYKYEDLLTNLSYFRECMSNFLETDVKMIEGFFKKPEFNWKIEYPNLMELLSDEFKSYLERYNYE
jgi:hypothetical protein